MEEVRTYWQVASISHFCNLFRKPFKLPSFEPEELEQAFILDVPAPPNSSTTQQISDNQVNSNHINNINNTDDDQHDNKLNNHIIKDETNEDDNNLIDEEQQASCPASPAPSSSTKSDYFPTTRVQSVDNLENTNNQLQDHQHQQHQPQGQSAQDNNKTDEQQPEHLLIKLAISLLKPHFSTKLTLANWENYLKRIIDSNWVSLENYPNPFLVSSITQDGVELTKNSIFNELTLSDKIDVIYALCDYRLWCEDAAEAVKEYPLDELRHENIGKDSQGYEYWYFSGTRLYRENKELSQDLIFRKKRIKELESNLVQFEKARILGELEEKKRQELERAKQLAAEAREAKSAAKRQQQQQQEVQNKRRKTATPSLPLRTGLRERRSSTTGNSTSNNTNNASPKNHTRQKQQAIQELQETRTLRSRVSKTKTSEEQAEPSPPQSTTSKGGRNSKQNDKSKNSKTPTPDIPKRSPEEECRLELERLTIKPEDRAEAWHMQCDSLEDWESFVVKFEKSKSTNEKYLTSYINEYILPKIRSIYAKRAAEIRRKEKELLLALTYSSRRVSSRIISKQKQEEEEERQAQIREAETRRKKEEAELRLRAELEREMRSRKNKFFINGEHSSACSEDGHVDIDSKNSGRYNLRQAVPEYNGNEFDGIIHPDNLADFYEAIELVIDTVRTSKHAWPFVNPVPETEPGYYDLIKQPMDLWKIRTKIEFREYKSFIELEKDFQLLVNNCEQFNGPRNVYTKMVYKLWKSFRKNVRLYLEKDLFMDEYETFLYPPPAPKKEPTPPPREPKPTPEPTSPNQSSPQQCLDKDTIFEEHRLSVSPTSQTIEVKQEVESQRISVTQPTETRSLVEQISTITQHFEPNSLANLCQKEELTSTTIIKSEQIPFTNKLNESSITIPIVGDKTSDNHHYPAFLDELKDEIPPEPVMELEI